MVVHKIIPLIKKTAEVTGYSEEQVASVIDHCFAVFKKYTYYPTKAGLRIPYIAVIRTRIKILNYYIHNRAIPLLRKGKITPERFRAYWNLRTLIRKDDERRDYKTRLGWEFNPSWRQDSDSTERNTGTHSD